MMFPIKQYYPHFLKHQELAPWSKVLSIYYEDCGVWYKMFLDRILKALVGSEYLPIYRISHGEYILAVGYKLHGDSTLLEWCKHHYFRFQRLIGVRPLFYSGSPDNSYEEFSKKEIEEARQIYIKGLHEVSENGLFAISFYLNKGFEEYIIPYSNWMERIGVELNKENYFSFYMVYCLLTGPDAFKILQGRKIVVVSSFNYHKTRGLEIALRDRGVIAHYFVDVSPSRAIFDKIDTKSIPFSPDLILIAAGVGSANIILQLKDFKCVMIDAGFALDALAFPEKRWNRPYCVPDNEFDVSRIKFLTQQRIKSLSISSVV